MNSRINELSTSSSKISDYNANSLLLSTTHMMAFGSRRFISRAILLVVIVLLAVSFLIMKSFEKSHLKLKVAKNRTEVDLVIVEEHHEVLEYWFEAARKGIIPKSGNTLLHIDAHSDMAPPENVEGYPFFRLPKNKDEIRAMMQSNDVFIQAAAMSGFLKKVIWVWPSWDERSHDSDDVTSFFGGGWTDVTIDGTSERTFCECELKKDGVTKTSCRYVNRTAMTDEDYDGTEIDTTRCNLKEKIEYQEIVGYNALQKLISGNLVKKEENLLLDIDQDYFGCVLRGQDLVDVGMAWEDVEEIDELLNALFCPQEIQHEGLGNDLMQMVLNLIIQKCKKTKQASKACVTPKHPVNKEFMANLNQITKLFIHKHMFCKMKKEDRERKMSLLVENFIRCSVNQLKSFVNIGFCMQTTPRAYESTPGFQLCHGANEPNTTIVTTHMPEESEVKLRLSRLRRIVQAKSYPTPGMVTLCRSVRDGYTPVHHFKSIENNIIDSIQRSRPGVKYKAIYDVNLLGGKKGWPTRQKNYNLPNQLGN